VRGVHAYLPPRQVAVLSRWCGVSDRVSEGNTTLLATTSEHCILIVERDNKCIELGKVCVRKQRDQRGGATFQ